MNKLAEISLILNVDTGPNCPEFLLGRHTIKTLPVHVEPLDFFIKTHEIDKTQNNKQNDIYLGEVH